MWKLRETRRVRAWVPLVGWLAFSTLSGCAGCDDSSTGGGGSGADSPGGGGAGANGGNGGGGANTQGGGGAGANGGGGAGAGGGGGEPSGGGGAGGGGPVTDAGAPGQSFVSAGGTLTSPGYRVVFTMGQSTQNQQPMSSPSYQLQGGLIGATGSLP